ncbi:MAG: hypothetical protein FJ388_10315, partial [Verrucomicrobia bacterium]|nr:hypothetical protein [Verrucomicrobiota bacterium]
MKHLRLICVALACLLGLAANAADPNATASQILETAGIKGGLIVHVGCGDGKLTAALRVNTV